MGLAHELCKLSVASSILCCGATRAAASPEAALVEVARLPRLGPIYTPAVSLPAMTAHMLRQNEVPCRWDTLLEGGDAAMLTDAVCTIPATALQAFDDALQRPMIAAA